MAFTTRRGRPARAKEESRDSGTPELQFKRALGVTSEPIDICLERRIINEAQHWSGMHLRWLYTLRYGAPTVTSQYGDRYYADTPPVTCPAWRSMREQEYQSAVLLLQQSDAYECVMRLCVFNEIPAFLSARLVQRAKQDNALEHQLHLRRRSLLHGLDLLVMQWRHRPAHSQ